MFHNISANMQEVMRAMEEQLARDQRSLRSVDSDVARVLTLLAISAPAGTFLELGSSGGYSSLWLSLVAREKGVTLTGPAPHSLIDPVSPADLAAETVELLHTVDDFVRAVALALTRDADHVSRPAQP